jgi:hypothetical protein
MCRTCGRAVCPLCVEDTPGTVVCRECRKREYETQLLRNLNQKRTTVILGSIIAFLMLAAAIAVEVDALTDKDKTPTGMLDRFVWELNRSSRETERSNRAEERLQLRLIFYPVFVMATILPLVVAGLRRRIRKECDAYARTAEMGAGGGAVPKNCPSCGADRIVRTDQFLQNRRSQGGPGCIGGLLLIIIVILAPGLVLIVGLLAGATAYALRVPIVIVLVISAGIAAVVRHRRSQSFTCEKCGYKFSGSGVSRAANLPSDSGKAPTA